MTSPRGTASLGSSSDAAAQAMRAPLEMWAGIECTINRVSSDYRDQLAYAGHYDRSDDADRLADLGVRTVRWPVLWERHHDNPRAWAHTDRALARFHARGVDPVIGLVHHGSGPAHTNLLDDSFPEKLAAFAATVARRYPWLTRFTPVNEPLTTARFSALYGLWYPHQANDAAFVRALVNQTRGIQEAMRAVQRVIPDATLVATEDLGYTHSTLLLRDQAAFENERRWLTFDLLNGRVDRHHALWPYLTRTAAIRESLCAVAGAAGDERLRPALHGINHYLTSERFLDDKFAAYPVTSRGGNGRQQYADVEAVRVLRDGPLGPERLIEQACLRYGTPVVVTEAHLACTREQQLLWLQDVWNAATAARAHGHDVRAVTAWSALGAFDWRSLLTQEDRAYESGLFDLRAPTPRPTALVTMVRSLATTGAFMHPVLESEPWWMRGERLAFPPQRGSADMTVPRAPIASGSRDAPTRIHRSPRPLLIAGGDGTLGVAFGQLASERGLAQVRLGRRDLDITDRAAAAQWLRTARPWAVVNAAGWVRVDDAESDPDGCMRSNADGAECLARACADAGIPFVTFSSDLVFSGGQTHPFVESDATLPANVYGHSKAEAERRVSALGSHALVVRSSAFFGDWDDWNFVSRTLATVQAGGRALAPNDAIVSPTYVTDLVHGVLDLLIDGETGIWHVANRDSCTWFELAQLAAGYAGLDPSLIDACQGPDIGWSAPRPAYAALGSERGTILGTLDDALHRYTRSQPWKRIARQHAHARPTQPSAFTLSMR